MSYYKFSWQLNPFITIDILFSSWHPDKIILLSVDIQYLQNGFLGRESSFFNLFSIILGVVIEGLSEVHINNCTDAEKLLSIGKEKCVVTENTKTSQFQSRFVLSTSFTPNFPKLNHNSGSFFFFQVSRHLRIEDGED